MGTSAYYLNMKHCHATIYSTKHRDTWNPSPDRESPAAPDEENLRSKSLVNSPRIVEVGGGGGAPFEMGSIQLVIPPQTAPQ